MPAYFDFLLIMFICCGNSTQTKGRASIACEDQRHFGVF